ncbi:MAG: carbonic anhydrase [Bacteroidetes bacterium]|nr:MAG: carbonic anhydrase [Bacteroidota bacterium]
MEIDQIFKNNKDWVSKKLSLDENYFKNMAKGQSPEYLYIGCSDSRVSAETMMGVEPGQVFVHRNIANMVPNTDLNVMSVINYGVTHLKVKHIIVCGHYHCGGIEAAMQHADLGILNPWLRSIRDVYRMYKPELDEIDDDEERSNHLVRLNVKEQCINVLKTAAVQKAVTERNLRVHGWVFDLDTGKLIDLKIDSQEILKDIREIYRLD